jgi:hypothetical protein
LLRNRKRTKDILSIISLAETCPELTVLPPLPKVAVPDATAATSMNQDSQTSRPNASTFFADTPISQEEADHDQSVLQNTLSVARISPAQQLLRPDAVVVIQDIYTDPGVDDATRQYYASSEHWASSEHRASGTA